MTYCVDCGKKIKEDLIGLCRTCRDKRNQKEKEEFRNLKKQRKKLQQKIVKEYMVYDKLQELEKVVKKPCMIDIHIRISEDKILPLYDNPYKNQVFFSFGSLNKKQKQIKISLVDKIVLFLSRKKALIREIGEIEYKHVKLEKRKKKLGKKKLIELLGKKKLQEMEHNYYESQKDKAAKKGKKGMYK